LRSKQNRLRCLGKASRPVCLGAFAGYPVAVQSSFLNQIECAWRESKLVLRDRQAASVSFHDD
jgi:hypothetical protein